MTNYVIINGVNSNTINGLGINELPPITKPQMRVQNEEIDGRDGDITTNLGYSAYDKTITIGLFGTGYDINDIVAFFNGEGTIVFSNEADKYYNFKIINQIDYVALQKFKTATITFHCQPFKYPLTETPLEIEYSYIEDEGESLTLNDTGESTLELNLKGNTSQTGTPTPSTPIDVNVVSGDNEVVVCGKNLFVKSSVIEDEKYLDNGTISTDSSYCRSPLYMNINGVSNLTISGSDSSSNGKVIIYDENKNAIDYWSTRNRTITIPNNSYYIRISVEKAYKDTLQVEAGDTATSYSSDSQTYPINLPVENLLNNVETTRTISGVTFTKNDDGSVVCNGTATADINSYKIATITLEAGTYTLSGCPSGGGAVSGKYRITNENGSFDDRGGETGETITKTFNNETTQKFYIQIYNGCVCNNLIFKPQLEKGTKQNRFTPYGTTPIEMCNIPNTTYKDGFAKNSGKQLWQGNKDYTGQGTVAQIHQTLALGTYTVSYYQSVNGTVQFNLKDSNGGLVQAVTTYAVAGYSTATFTVTSNEVSDIWLYLSTNMTVNNIMINVGETAEMYEPYGTGQWCKYNAIKEYTFTGNETWQTSTYGTNSWNCVNVINVNYDTSKKQIMSNIFRGCSNDDRNTAGDNLIYTTPGNVFTIRNTTLTTLSEVQTATNGNKIVYACIPYLSLIEDNNLIEQLDNLQNAMSYEGTTNINQVNDDKAFIISTKALEQGSNEVVVNNIGNAYSKPLIALEGSGNVDIYLGNTQILKANVEDKMNIDIAKLEAYNPDTSVLLNRQVIGNYNSMILQPGNNTIRIDGALDKATISNYTRWL